MTRRFPATLCFAAALLTTLFIDTASAQVATAVDDVHISPPNTEVPRLLERSSDTIAAAHITLIDLITAEYPYPPDHIVGLTPEQRTTRFNVVAKIDPPGVPDPEHDPRAHAFAIDALLKNHFHLIVHETGKPFEQLVAIAPKAGPCLADSSASTNAPANHIPTECMTMDDLAARLSNQLNIRVVNLTKLQGAFAIGLNWSPALSPPFKLHSNFPFPPASLQTALRVDLGLALVPVRGQTENKVLVVDHVELPPAIGPTNSATTK